MGFPAGRGGGALSLKLPLAYCAAVTVMSSEFPNCHSVQRLLNRNLITETRRQKNWSSKKSNRAPTRFTRATRW